MAQQPSPQHSVAPAWMAMLDDARHLAEALTGVGTQLARRLPGYDLTSDQLRRLENAVLREVKQRLDAVAAEEDQTRHSSAPARLLDELLGASIESDTERSREFLYLRILGSLVPDEARILAALADGTRYPLVHVQTRSTGVQRTLLADASTIGRAAGIHLNQAVPVYVGHLRTLGLVEEGPEDDSLGTQYEILQSEDYVRRADQEARNGGLRGARIVRRTLRISALGRQLWTACRPDDPAPNPLGDGPGHVVQGGRTGFDGTSPDRSRSR